MAFVLALTMTRQRPHRPACIGPWPRSRGRCGRPGGRRSPGICRRRGDAARPVGRRRGRAHGAAARAGRRSLVLSLAVPRAALPVGRRARIRPRCGWSAPSATSTGWSPRAAPTTRPWLDHGRWGVRHPLGEQRAGRGRRRRLRVPRRRRPAAAPDPGRPGACRHHRARPFPLHRQRRDRGAAGGAARLRAQGHRRPDGRRAARARGQARRRASPATARSPMRIAFARAVEAALGIEPPPRAVWLRALMAELERLANHFGDIGAICNDASFSLMHAHCGILREQVLRAADACFGHRLMMDRVVPGGVAADLGKDGDRGIARRCIAHHPPALSRAGRALRQHRLAAGPHRRHRHPEPELARAIRRRRLRRPRLGPRRSMRARRRATRPTTSLRSRCRCAQRRRRRRARLGPHRRGRHSPGADRADPRSACRTAPIRADASMPLARRRRKGWRWSRASAATSWPGCALGARRHDRALPPARPVLVPVAAARGGDRRQHRRRLPALQQIVQLLLLRATISRDQRCASFCSRACCSRR